MIRPDHPTLSIAPQYRLASISRSCFYHAPKGESPENLALMAEIDRQFLETPFYGARQMTWHLRAERRLVNVKRVRRLMRLMGLMPIYRKPRTSIPAKGHKTYPYLLRGLTIDRPNQAWCADITYNPLAKGFLYLVAIMALRQAQGVEAEGPGLAALEHRGRAVLRRGTGGGARPPWPARDRQHRPGQPVHLVGVGRSA